MVWFLLFFFLLLIISVFLIQSRGGVRVSRAGCGAGGSIGERRLAGLLRSPSPRSRRTAGRENPAWAQHPSGG